MKFLKLFLLAGLAIASTAQAEETVAPFHAQDPVGRGIFDRKEKKLLRLYCQQRKNQKCVQAQYGLSDFNRSKIDELGNLTFADGVIPVGPIVTLENAKEINADVLEVQKNGIQYPRLNFHLTKKSWAKQEWSDKKNKWTEGYIREISYGDGVTLVVFAGLITFGIAPALAYSGPTIVDLTVNTAKIAYTSLIFIPNEIMKLFIKNPSKIVHAMTETSKDWQFKPMGVSHKTFTKTLDALETFTKEETRN